MTSSHLAAAITDARALLDTLIAAGWQEVHLVSPHSEIFIARPAGRPNPMRASQPLGVDAPVPLTTAEVTAGHVATLVSTLPIGTRVAAGDPVALLQVLDVEEALTADCAGEISAVHASAGTLLEFGMPVVSIARAVA